MKYIQSYYTDIGTTRQNNEDSLLILKAETKFGDVLFSVICDGMGGHCAGEVASKYCVQRCSAWFKHDFPPLLYHGFTEKELKTVWEKLLADINHQLVLYGKSHGFELGSTLTALLFCRDKCYVLHVGDSRCYQIADQVRQITIDHTTLAPAMVPDASGVRRMRSYLTESVGITDHVHPFFHVEPIQENTTYLLCTDGFWHHIQKEELARYLSESTIRDNKMMRMHLNFLIEQVKLRGETDNITTLAMIPKLRLEESEQSSFAAYPVPVNADTDDDDTCTTESTEILVRNTFQEPFYIVLELMQVHSNQDI